MTHRFLAGTALCVLMTAPYPALAKNAAPERPIMLVQAEEPLETEQEAPAGCPAGTAPGADGECVPIEGQPPAEEVPPEAIEEAPAVDEPPAEEIPAEPTPEEIAPEAPAPEEAAPEEPAPEELAPEEPAPEELAPEEPVPEEPAPAEEAPAEMQTEPMTEPESAPAPIQEAPDEAEETTPPAEEEAPAAEEPAEDEAAPVETLQEQPAAPEEQDEPAAAQEGEDAMPAEEPGEAATGQDEEAPAEADEQIPVEETAEPAPEEAETMESGEEELLPEDAAPVLDSQKEGAVDAEAAGPDGAAAEEGAAPQPAQETEAEAPEGAAGAEPVPETDAQAQQNIMDPQRLQAEIRSIVEEEGEAINLGQTPEDMRMRRAEFYRPRENARVVEEYNDNRTIVEINNHYYVESSDYDRIVMRDDRVYYEELRGGRVREVIERSDGTRVITVRNRYGDIIRRVRVTPDGREYVLAYLPEDRFDTAMHYEDLARELPPLRLTIPVSDYILEADRVEDPDRYYTFLDQPPVEPVERLYSVEEVKYSARVRDMVRRIDLDTIEFEFGSARIEESEIADLEAVADAILRMLDENPAETFLIEGHTDAVGSEMANLALSDRRAEAVARALSDVFGVPPENLITQGYGEQYLKIRTERRERENRRVAVRRITPLITPVAARQ
ncbi:OmpA family protein [Chelativorans sp. M5D2P16]|uniref:OmpA family protein n=1 Tax=Chelativorans sp. M5D2P16 TaxID=3095678 RepID=UPI002ACAF0B7|nr:OmpA family protein [Chelativorans sp. M5D2P16]MDZ5698125.1 OmpA family protein [Chelativorans sp. M5D2P16]